MKKRPVLPLVLSMSLPMVLSMMVTSLYNIVDSYYVAKISDRAMTALSLVFPVQNLINAVTIGFSIGINAVIAYHLGAGEEKSANAAASQGMLCSVIHGLLLTVGTIAVMPWFLTRFTDDAVVIDYGVRYARIAFAFSLVIAVSMAWEKIFQAMGRMLMTMLCMLAGCVTNIILDPVLIFGYGPFPEMGIEGAALATGIGQSIGLVIYLVCYRFGSVQVRLSREALRAHRGLWKRVYAVGIPASLNLALPSVLISALNVILAASGEIDVLVLGVYYKLQTFLYLPANGLVQGMRPIIGYNYGAREHGRVRRIYRVTMALAAGIMALGTVLSWTIPETLIGLFSTDSAAIAAGATALRTISLGFVVSTISVISAGALEGLGMGNASFRISLLRYVAVILPLAFLFSRLWGAEGVWHAFWVTELITAAAAFLLYRSRTERAARETPPAV